MIHFLRHLIAAPVRVLLWLCGFLPFIDQLRLAEIIWRITADADDPSIGRILGTLENNGEMIGDFRDPPLPGDDGLFVRGDFQSSAASSLEMRSPTFAVRIAGDFDVRIDDNDRFNLQGAELRMLA